MTMPDRKSPLVSILIPAFNAQEWIADTIRSALAQTWPNKEIIVVDDGSRDQTLRVARSFASRNVKVVAKENEGAATTRNRAYALSQGDYIQWLDADDLLSRDKIERQLTALQGTDGRRTLLSSAWAYFAYRAHRARFVPTPLWQDLTPVDWLVHKMGKNLHMQTATWLTSRELAEAAGAWDTRLLSDDDGEYFCRVLMASNGVRFVPEAKVYYRSIPSGQLSYIGSSNRKMDAMLVSMKLHVQYIRSLEDSERVRDACRTYVRSWSVNFDPNRRDIASELQALVGEFSDPIEFPGLRWKYAWMAPLIGYERAWRAQLALPRLKARLVCGWDRTMSKWDARHDGAEPTAGTQSGVRDSSRPSADPERMK
jgi:glycosyltransferase involved in cell wall biosynthesis